MLYTYELNFMDMLDKGKRQLHIFLGKSSSGIMNYVKYGCIQCYYSQHIFMAASAHIVPLVHPNAYSSKRY